MSEYTAKDIILSTKDKLAELEKKLKKLKEMTCIAEDKNIKDVRYNIINIDNGDKTELDCLVSWNDKRLKGIIKNLQLKLNLFAWGSEAGKVVRDNNGNSYILNNEYHLYIPSEYQEEFRSVADEILSDEFVNEFLKGNWFYPPPNSGYQSTLIYPNKIIISNFSKELYLNFYTDKNAAQLKSSKGYELSEEMLYELLNMKLSESCFSDYRRKVIESSKSRNKGIIISEFNNNSGKVDFNVEEDENNLYLVKK